MTDKKYLQYIQINGLYNFRDKADNVANHVLYMLCRTQSMFKWHNLPDTIPEEYLESYLQTVGVCAIIKAGGELYAVTGGLGGEPDAYYQPTLFTVANPALQSELKPDGMYKIGEECEIIKNDPYYLGLIPMYKKYASQLAENELSLNIASINTRLQKTLRARDDSTKEACDKYMDDIADGKLASILDDGFEDDDLQALQMDASRTGAIGDLIEYQQYIKASWYNEIGLNANYNMKREALNSAESSINDDILFPLVDTMLKERQKACDSINSLFGTDISVDLASSWEDNKEEEKAEINAIDDSTEDRPEETTGDEADKPEEAEESEEKTEETEEEKTEEAADKLETVADEVETIADELETDGDEADEADEEKEGEEDV